MIRKKDIKEAAEDAVERGSEALSDIREYLTEQTKNLAEDAKEKVVPLTDRISPLLNDVVEKVQDTYQDAREWAEKDALPKIQGLWDDAAENEHVQGVTDRAAALLASAKSEFANAQEELPKLAEKAKASSKKVAKQGKCAARKAAKEAKASLKEAEKAAEASLKEQQLELKKTSKPHKVLKTLGLIALFSAIAYALKQFLSPKDDGWTPQQPSAPYHPRNVMTDLDADGVSTDDQPDTSDPDDLEIVDGEEVEVLDDLKDKAEDVATAVKEKVEPVVESVTEKVSDLADQVSDEASEKDPFRFGEGSFIGDNPPEQYTIKGNERSMKYHTPESAGYDRTITDVWFDSEGAAEAAGFVRAQR